VPDGWMEKSRDGEERDWKRAGKRETTRRAQNVCMCVCVLSCPAMSRVEVDCIRSGRR